MNGYGQLGKDLCKGEIKRNLGDTLEIVIGEKLNGTLDQCGYIHSYSYSSFRFQGFFQTKGVYPLSMLGFQALNKNNKFHRLHF